MGSRNQRDQAVGIDVSAKELHVAVENRDVVVFDNTATGHKKLVAYVTEEGCHARVVLEATGAYHEALTVLLAKHQRCSVMVANPRATKHFHQAQGIRAKTDKVDAISLLQFALRMPFQEWQCPSDEALQLRASARFIDQLIKDQTRIKNQIHAAGVSSNNPPWVLQQLATRRRDIADMIRRGQAELLKMAKKNQELKHAVELLDSIPGIGAATAVRLVAEFLFLPDDMNGKEITAWVGLDPRPRESGSSVHGKRHMSKRGNARVRKLLFMPALTAVRKDGPLKDLKERVASRSGHKLVGIGAVMRKLLIVSWAIYRTKKPWDQRMVQPRRQEAKAA